MLSWGSSSQGRLFRPSRLYHCHVREIRMALSAEGHAVGHDYPRVVPLMVARPVPQASGEPFVQNPLTEVVDLALITERSIAIPSSNCTGSVRSIEQNSSPDCSRKHSKSTDQRRRISRQRGRQRCASSRTRRNRGRSVPARDINYVLNRPIEAI